MFASSLDQISDLDIYQQEGNTHNVYAEYLNSVYDS